MDLSPFTLTITFLGLIAFVPIETNDRLETMWVLLPNASEGRDPCDPRATRPEHHAFLRYSLRNLAGSSNLAGFADNQIVLTPFQGMDLSIEASPGESTVADHCSRFLEEGRLRRYRARQKSTDGVLSTTPTEDCERRDFSWVPDLRRFAGPVATICDACLKKPPVPEGVLSRIASRIELTQGTLHVGSFDMDDGVSSVVFEFESGSSSDRQALADEVSLRLEGLTRPVTLVLSSLRNPSAPPKRITLAPAKTGEDVKVAVLNHVPQELLELRNPHLPTEVVEDFRLYYRLSAAIDPGSGSGCEKHALPVPRQVRSGPRLALDLENRPICPPAQMSAPPAPALSENSHVP